MELDDDDDRLKTNGGDGSGVWISDNQPRIRLYEDNLSRKIGMASVVTFVTAAAIAGSVPFLIRNASMRRSMMRNRRPSEKDFRQRVSRERENMRRFMNERERARKNGYPNRSSSYTRGVVDLLHFERLGLDPSKRPLLLSDLKTAYQTQAMKWHPDRLPVQVSDEDKRKRHEEQFKRINNSYQYLLKRV